MCIERHRLYVSVSCVCVLGVLSGRNKRKRKRAMITFESVILCPYGDSRWMLLLCHRSASEAALQHAVVALLLTCQRCRFVTTGGFEHRMIAVNLSAVEPSKSSFPSPAPLPHAPPARQAVGRHTRRHLLQPSPGHNLLRRHDKHAARAVSHSRSLKWGEKYRDVIVASLHTDDLLTSDVAFIKQLPAFQRRCVDASSLHDSATLPCECVFCV